jgi:DNA-directed RNA polymerase subunit RPC12/RpoP
MNHASIKLVSCYSNTTYINEDGDMLDRCPGCGYTPSVGGGMKVYQCNNCPRKFCEKEGNANNWHCPNCDAKDYFHFDDIWNDKAKW